MNVIDYWDVYVDFRTDRRAVFNGDVTFKALTEPENSAVSISFSTIDGEEITIFTDSLNFITWKPVYRVKDVQ